jgi:hypothetical protein
VKVLYKNGRKLSSMDLKAAGQGFFKDTRLSLKVYKELNIFPGYRKQSEGRYNKDEQLIEWR